MLVDCFPDLLYLDYKLISNQPSAQSTQSKTGVADATCRDIARPLNPAHKEFSCCCCREVSWTTFLGLQFQMDCVGRVMPLS